MVKDKAGGASKCVFCRIGKRLTDTELLYWDNHIFVIRDARPKAPTHLLLIPFRHVKSLAYVNPGLEPRLGHVFMVAEEMAALDAIKWVTLTTGSYDIFTWATLSSPEELGIFLRSKVGTIQGVRRTETFVNLSTQKRGSKIVI